MKKVRKDREMGGIIKENKGLQYRNGMYFCPVCKERLTPADLESYPRCPYCDHPFPDDTQLEDFILSPLLKHWAGQIHSQFPNG